MGHFSYSCQLSGIPITSGAKCAILPILPSSNVKYLIESDKKGKQIGKPTFLSNDGHHVLYTELFFPIFGEYDEYGGLENIVKDDNTAILEEYYSLSIEGIVKILTCGRRDDLISEDKKMHRYSNGHGFYDANNPRHEDLLRASLVWYRTELYQELAKPYKENSYNINDLDIGIPALLKKLGFKQGKVNKKKERYNIPFTKDGLTIYSDGNWINIPKQSVYSLKQLKKYCQSQGVEIDITEVDKSYNEQVYEILLPTAKDYNSSNRWIGDRIRHLLLDNRQYVSSTENYIDNIILELNIILLYFKVKISKFKNNTINDDVILLKSIIDDYDISIEELINENEFLKTEELSNIDLNNLTLENCEFIFNHIKEITTKLKDNKDNEIKFTNINHFYFYKIQQGMKEGKKLMFNNIIDWHNVVRFYYPLGKYLAPIGTSCQDGDYRATMRFATVLKDTMDNIWKERVDSGYEDDEDLNEDDE